MNVKVVPVNDGTLGTILKSLTEVEIKDRIEITQLMTQVKWRKCWCYWLVLLSFDLYRYLVTLDLRTHWHGLVCQKQNLLKQKSLKGKFEFIKINV